MSELDANRAPGNEHSYSLIEETAHAATHGVGAALSVVGLVVLLYAAGQSGSPTSIYAAGVYGSTLIVLYLSSTLYHGLPASRAKQWFLLFDHCAIFLLIAGTYTPFAVLLLPPAKGVPLLVGVWGLAAIGIAFKVVAFLSGRLERFGILSVAIYLAMGWMGLFWAPGELAEALSPGGLSLLLAGGGVYTAGLIFYAWRRIPFHHAVWHVFVLAASTCHFLSILYYVVPVA